MNTPISTNPCRKPTFPVFMAIFYVLAFGMSASPALYDGFFNRLDDELIGYIFCVIAGLPIAIAVVWSMLSGYKNTSMIPRHNYRFYGGIAACISLALLRFWAAGDSAWAILLAVSLFLLELTIVLLCEGTASSLRVQYRDYLVIKGNLERQAALVDTARRPVERTEKIIAEIKRKIDAYNEEIKDRISLRGQIEPLKKLAVSVVLDGHQAGLAEIEGRFHVNWKVDDEFQGGAK